MPHLGRWVDAMYDNSIGGQAMVDAGVDGLLGYMGTPGNVKDVTSGTIADLRAHGRFFIAVFEVSTNDATNAPPNIEYGEAVNNANRLMDDVLAAGGDNTIHVCPAIDEHVYGQVSMDEVLAYQRGFFDAVKGRGWRGRVGVYGFSEVAIAVRAAGTAEWFWVCGSAAAIPSDNTPPSNTWVHLWQDNTGYGSVGGVEVDNDWLLTPLPAPLPPPRTSFDQTRFLLLEG